MTVYAVNSKEPAACWIPSLDTAGNGTTTLTDLVGNKNGTLTNFALSGSTSNWVGDTAAGGVLALDLDGTNDFVLTNYKPVFSAFSISCWVKLSTLVAFSTFVSQCDSAVSIAGNWTIGLSAANVWRMSFRDNASLVQAASASVATTGSWFHLVGVYNSTNVTLYLNAASTASVPAGTQNTSSTQNIVIGARDAGFAASPMTGRIDDVRLFDLALDSSDVAYLYNFGIGRGRVASASGSLFLPRGMNGGYSNRNFDGGYAA